MDTPSESGWSATLPVNAYSAMAMRPWNSLRNKRRVRYQTFFAKIVGPPPNLQDDFGTYEHRANQADGPGLTAPNRPFNLRVERRANPAGVAASIGPERSSWRRVGEMLKRHRWSLAMPRYFFHLNRNDEAGLDNDGLTFLDHQAAWEEATMACGEMIRTIDGHLQPGASWRMEVTDETGKLIYRLRFIAESFE